MAYELYEGYPFFTPHFFIRSDYRDGIRVGAHIYRELVRLDLWETALREAEGADIDGLQLCRLCHEKERRAHEILTGFFGTPDYTTH